MNTLERLQNGQLNGAKRLDLSCGLTTFPREIFALADTLEVLNLSGNQLSDLPDDLSRLHQLKVLFCSDNAFTHVPASVGRCPQLSMVGFKSNRISQLTAQALPAELRWLILTDNALASLPDELGQCHQLQKLMLAGNRLQRLPDALQHCHRLELLRISANRLTALPDWLTRLPRLSWLAYAGNPLSDADEARAVAATPERPIAWSSLDLTHQLGEGASGHIHQATWRHNESDEDVAVKLFKGAMTSDGLPRSEIAACLAAGPHPHLIGLHGVVNDHPDQRIGLVMQRIGRDFQPLAGPPSLATCTRDVYASDLRMDLNTVVRLALGMAAVTAHLHARGILHGDLYAHNTLWNNHGQCLLGDFGAASFLPAAALETSQQLTALEVRAFGCLLEELLALCQTPDQTPDQASDRLTRAHALQARCTLEDVAARPAMAEVEQQLRDMASV